MSSDNTIGILELNTKEIKCIIAKFEEDEGFNILGISTKPSKGIHNGVIINLLDATETIRSCISEAEIISKIFLKKIYILLELSEFLCTRVSKYKKIGGAKIEKEDISYLIREAKNQVISNNLEQSIIHIFNYNYFIDDKEINSKPIGIFANRIRHELSLITSPTTILKNINQTLVNCDIEIAKFISKSFSLGISCLNHSELNLGATIINFDYEKTDIIFFQNSALIYSRSIPVGINHITKDISRGCSLSLEEAEIIKNEFEIINFYESKKKNLPLEGLLRENFFITSNYRKITNELIYNIMISRIEEIFELLRKEIIFSGIKNTAGKNILVNANKSFLSKLKILLSTYFSCNVKEIISEKLNFDGKESSDLNASLGALKIIRNGFETEAIAQEKIKSKGKLGILSKIFGLNY